MQTVIYACAVCKAKFERIQTFSSSNPPSYCTNCCASDSIYKQVSIPFSYSYNGFGNNMHLLN